MLNALIERGERLAAEARERRRHALVDELARVPGVRAEIAEDGVAVRGRRLAARWLTDTRLRWLGRGR